MKKQNLTCCTLRYTMIFLVFPLLFQSCSKSQLPGASDLEDSQLKESNLQAMIASEQPLPGGKARFSAVMGNMDLTGETVVRICNWTFDKDAGTVAATYWDWNTVAEKGKTLFNAHTCTFENISKTANPYTPTGWMAPAAQYFGRTGIYTYNATAGVLSIAWNAPWAGVTESWNVTNPDAFSAKVSLRSSNYGLTHGRGYGSNASWSTFKTVAQVPRILYRGFRIAVWSKNGTTIFIDTTVTGAWKADKLNLTPFTSSANGNTLHVLSPSSADVCNDGCTTSRTGIIYHLASNNNGRSMVYNHFCACLPTNAEFPTYDRNLHPYAFQQIIDDNGDMRGFVGIEQQDQPGSAGYQYQLKEYFQ